MDIAKKYPYSLVQVRSGVGEEQTVINIGVIIYEEDKKTIHQVYYHPDRDLIRKYLYDVNSYYSFFKECQKNKKVGLLPMELYITEPKTFKLVDAFGEEQTYKYVDELAYYIISTLVCPKELRTMFCTRKKQFVLENSVEVKVEINSSLEIKGANEEYPCIDHITVSFYQNCYDDKVEHVEYIKEKIGYFEFAAYNERCGYCLETAFWNFFDSCDDFQVYAELFENDLALKEKYAAKIKEKYSGFVADISIRPIILEKCFIKEKFRGKHLFKTFYERALEILNYNTFDVDYLILLSPYDYENEKEENTLKLKQYYKEIGFVDLGKINDNYLMCHPSIYILQGISDKWVTHKQKKLKNVTKI